MPSLTHSKYKGHRVLARGYVLVERAPLACELQSLFPVPEAPIRELERDAHVRHAPHPILGGLQVSH